MQMLLVCITWLTLLGMLYHATAEIIVHPVDQVVALGQTTPVVFTCYSEGTAFWRVNGRVVYAYDEYERELAARGIVNGVPYHYGSRLNLTLTVSVTLLNNYTNVSCIQPSGNENVTSVLIIAGPPLSPSPNFAIVNSTTLIVHWEKPFTWRQFDIQNYTVRMRNSTTGEVITRTINVDGFNQTDYVRIITSTNGSSRIEFMVVADDGSTATDCHELQFNVTATNAIGESRAGQVDGGFPIAPGPFITASVWHEVTFDVQLNPNLKINFTFPTVCPFQRANYIIKLFIQQQQEENEVIFTTGMQPYIQNENNGGHVKISVEDVLEPNMEYTVMIIAETIVGDRNVSFDISTMPQTATENDNTVNIPTSTTMSDHSTTDERQTLASKYLLGALTGSVAFILLLAIVTVSMCIITVCVMRQRAAKRRESIQKAELSQSVVKACEKMEANPIYSSEYPIYDVIVEKPMLRSLQSRESQTKERELMDLECNLGQYVELSNNAVNANDKIAQNQDSMSAVESEKLAECCTVEQAFKPGSLGGEDMYTVMSPAGTVRSCSNGSNQEAATSPGSCCQQDFTLQNGRGGIGQPQRGMIGCPHGHQGQENRYVMN